LQTVAAEEVKKTLADGVKEGQQKTKPSEGKAAESEDLKYEIFACTETGIRASNEDTFIIVDVRLLFFG
jgi:hypothetical protein